MMKSSGTSLSMVIDFYGGLIHLDQLVHDIMHYREAGD